jgi:hypothetical protein
MGNIDPTKENTEIVINIPDELVRRKDLTVAMVVEYVGDQLREKLAELGHRGSRDRVETRYINIRDFGKPFQVIYRVIKDAKDEAYRNCIGGDDEDTIKECGGKKAKVVKRVPGGIQSTSVSGRVLSGNGHEGAKTAVHKRPEGVDA